MEPAPELEVNRVSFASYARLLGGNRNFRRLWSAQVVSEIGDWFYTLAIYNLLLQLTGRAGSVALALVLQVLPQTLIGPTAGVVNDRLRRKHVMIAANIGRTLIVLCMLLIRSKEKVWLVYPLLMAETLLVAFFEPARNAVIANIVQREDVVVANTLSSTDVVGKSHAGCDLGRGGRGALWPRYGLSAECAVLRGFRGTDLANAFRRAPRRRRSSIPSARVGGFFAHPCRDPLRAGACSLAGDDPCERSAQR